MSHLTIRNIGPIKDVDIELNKVNFFIGPQSSGKSTIAKIISFCSWLEKVVPNEEELIGEGREAYRRLMSYHHMESYFSEDSALCYVGENIVYTYNWSKRPIDMPWRDYNTVSSPKESIYTPYNKNISPKVIYIPAERNFVSRVPNLGKYAEDNDNLMDFVQDSLDACRRYSAGNRLHLLNLGADYYYQDGLNNIELTNGKRIPLDAASSGLQSIVPLLTLIDWLADGIYRQEKPFSFDEREQITNILTEINRSSSTPDEVDRLKARLAGFVQGKIYTHTQFIVEEPEQNLFPTTQCELVYYLLRAINHGRKHRLVVTTHSPYVLYALNNAMLLSEVDDRLPASLKDGLQCRDSSISSDLVSIWQIEAGNVTSIKNERTRLLGKHYFNDVMDRTLGDYYKMVGYLK